MYVCWPFTCVGSSQESSLSQLEEVYVWCCTNQCMWMEGRDQVIGWWEWYCVFLGFLPHDHDGWQGCINYIQYMLPTTLGTRAVSSQRGGHQ